MATPSNPLSELLAEKGVLLADGATGTNLFAMGLEAGEAPELWLESAPEKIAKLHQDFVDAGATVATVNDIHPVYDALSTATGAPSAGASCTASGVGNRRWAKAMARACQSSSSMPRSRSWPKE